MTTIRSLLGVAAALASAAAAADEVYLKGGGQLASTSVDIRVLPR